MTRAEVATRLIGASVFRSAVDATLLCVLVAKSNGDRTVGLTLTTAEAVALIAALLADGEVHQAWLNGGGK